jgi:5-methylcytosine-specific restriction endonuclease McrA
MSYDRDRLRRIFDRTNGLCHVCRKALAWRNYGKNSERGAWEVEHSKARARGGTDHLTNLFAACIPCNRSKGSGSSRSARRQHGYDRAPRSAAAQRKKRGENVLGYASVGALVARVVLGPGGWVVGAIVGGLLGSDEDVV